MNEGLFFECSQCKDNQPTDRAGGREVFDQTSMRHFVPVPAWNKKWRAFSLDAPFTYLFLTHKTNRTLWFPLSSSIQHEYEYCGNMAAPGPSNTARRHHACSVAIPVSNHTMQLDFKWNNRSILWKYGCPGSFNYGKKTPRNRKTQRKPSQVEQQSIKSHSACSGAIPVSNHAMHQLVFLAQCLFVLLAGVTAVLASLSLAILLLPRLIIEILIRMIISIFYLILGAVDDFMWDVWLGKYSDPTKHHRGSVFLSTAIKVLYGVRPFFAVNPNYCEECTNAHESAMTEKKKYCHIDCTVCNKEYVKCLIPE